MKTTTTLPSDIKHLLIDSRDLAEDPERIKATAFVAIKTPLADGHKFIKGLYEKGVRCFIVNRIPDGEFGDATFVVTENTGDFLVEVARERLDRFKGKQIVITGSYGKTRAKERLAALLPDAVRSPRSWNSGIGVPLSIFKNTAEDHQFLITEVGIDGPGQADRLKDLLRPEIGVITAITDEHDEHFESHRKKIEEKVNLVKDAAKIYYENSDPEVLECLLEMTSAELIPYSRLEDVFPGEVAPVSTRFEVREVPGNCVLALDSFTNDAPSLEVSLQIARRRLAGRKLVVMLGGVTSDPQFEAELNTYNVEKSYFFPDEKSVKEFVQTAVREDFRDMLLLIKSTGTVSMEPIVTFLDEARHDTSLEVDLDALVHNFNYYRSLLPPGTGIVAMVKASAYGVGALEVAKTLESRRAAYLAVAVVDEAVALRRAGIKMPIIVLNPITNNFEALFKYRLEPAVFTLEELIRIANEALTHGIEKVPVHVKFDTGMHRLGFLAEDIPALTTWLKANPLIRVESVFSHLSTADCPELKDYTEKQVSEFKTMTERFAAELGCGFKRHLLNTAGISTFGHTDAAFDMARLGLGLYGISPLGEDETRRLRPVARLVSTIISIKKWPEGTPIGYGCRGITDRDSIIATVPIGYADGVDRHLGRGKAQFVVNGVKCPTIGNICMDLLMLDVTDVPNVKVGDEVEIFGPSAPIEKLAETLDTIPYEVLTSISPRVRRTYFHR